MGLAGVRAGYSIDTQSNGTATMTITRPMTYKEILRLIRKAGRLIRPFGHPDLSGLRDAYRRLGWE